MRKLRKNWMLVILGGFYLVLMAWLHYRQAANQVVSDMPAYVLMIKGENELYSFPYPIFFVLARLFSIIFSIPVAITIVLTFFNGLAILTVFKWIDSEFPDWLPYIKNLSVVCIFVVSMIFWPLNIQDNGEWWKFKYLGVFSPNIYHNATYLITRPFSIMLFFTFLNIENGHNKIKDYILLCLWLLLGVLAKPSFAFVFLPVMALVTLNNIIKTKKILPHGAGMLIAVIPSCIVLLYQFFAVFDTNEADAGIHIGFAVAWHVWTKGIKMAYIKANFFPLVYLVLHYKYFIKSRILRFSWYTHMVGLGTFLFFYEGGFRLNDANLAWGYMHGMFFVFLTSIVLLAKELNQKKNKAGWREWLSLFCLIPHVLCGVLFFIHMLSGGSATW